MNIVVISGSPKGKYSISLQTVLFLQNRFQDDSFEVLHVGQKIKSIEKDNSEIISAIEKADMLLFVYPVYTFIAPSQLHKFIELLKTWNIDLSKKYACQISTSKHFYDVTANKYIEQNCTDLGLKFVSSLSCDMEDLLNKKGRDEAISFWKYIHYCVENDMYKENKVIPVAKRQKPYSKQVKTENAKDNSKTICIITDAIPSDENLNNMISDFISESKYQIKLVNLNDFSFSGGCLGCFNCAVTGKCVYKDGFDSFLRNEIQCCDAAVYAFTIKDHSMGSLFKMYDDRQFCNGHRTVTMGSPVAYIISGNYSAESNLAMIVEGRAEVGHNYLCGITTDENSDNDIYRNLSNLSKKLSYALENKYVLPQNFYGVGGLKIFRDLIYTMRGLMKADHKFYKEHGFYDFPQKKRADILKMQLLGALINMPSIKNKLGNKMNEGMIAPYKKVINSND